MDCECIEKLVVYQKPLIENEMNNHQWYMGIEEDRPIERVRAELSYFSKFGKDFMAECRNEFCTNLCDKREICDLYLGLKEK